MNQDSLTSALSHIGNLIVNVTKKNLNTSVEELKELICVYGGEAERHLYRLVLSQLEWSTPYSSETKPSTSGSLCVITPHSPGSSKEKDSLPGPALIFNESANSSATVLLLQQLSSVLPLHRITSNLAVAISTPFCSTKVVRQSWVSSVSSLLKLTRVQEVVVCLKLLHCSNSEIKNQSLSLLKAKLPDLVRSYIEADGGGRELNDLSTESLHLILTSNLPVKDSSSPANHSVTFSNSGQTSLLTPDLRQELVTALQKEFPIPHAPLVLRPLLYSNIQLYPGVESSGGIQSSQNMTKNLLDGSLADLVQEIGYSFCNSLEECRNNLVSFGIMSITPAAVAKVIGLMVKTHSGLQSEQMGLQNLNDPNSLWNETKDNKTSSVIGSRAPGGESVISGNHGGASGSWNVEVFIKALLEIVPNLSLGEVMIKLDYKGFFINDRQGMKILAMALTCLQGGPGSRLDHFPIECFYRHWANSDEQVSLLTQILSNPDVMCLADYPCHVIHSDGLKTLPESDNKEVITWKSLELLEILLYLGDVGHYNSVKGLFKFPIQHCPDILVLGLIQVSLPFTMLRQDLLASLIPIFLGTHPNSAIVLHHVWHIQKDTSTVRQIVMHSMSEWYMALESDQTRLSRILDVAQDLKALSSLLNAQPHAFVIDLACLAYRREYLKLDKWLTDKIMDQGEPFVTSCVKFLQRRCPQLVGGKEDILPKPTQLPTETVTTILACLQACAMNLHQDLSDQILTMVQNCSLINRPRSISLLGFPSVGESLGGLSSTMGSLTLGASPISTIFPPSSISIGSLGTIGQAPASPARPLTQPSSTGNTIGSLSSISINAQSSLSSILPPLQMTSQGLGGPPQLTGQQITGPPQLTGQQIGAQLAGPPQLGAQPAVGSQLQPSSASSLAPARTHTVQAAPAAQPRQPAMDISQIFEIPQIISKEVEDEANSYFQRIYNHPPHPTLSIEEILEMLKNFHESSNKRENEVYSCMLKNLYEEYRFFPTYPNRELILTARLFGGIIEQGLVEYLALGVALRYVVEALQKPHGSKMYFFGIVALDRFRGSLKEYPRYCQHLMAIEHFNEFPPHLVEYIKFGTRSQEPPTKPSGVVLPPSMNISPSTPVLGVATSTVGSTAPSVTGTIVAKPVTAVTTVSAAISRPPQSLATGSGKPTIATTNIETLLVATEKDTEKLSPPPDHMQDKIAFIFNNLSQLNLPQKCEELKEAMTDEHWPWVAQYLVLKRASIENNFHTLYSLLLDQLNMTNVSSIVLQETLRNVKVLLRADKTAANLSDKSLLKNLGHWLGMVTLAKNRPILHTEVDVKSMLIEAYKNGLQELQYVIPFVAKVVESCAKSRVFSPPNPWTMALMNVLAELHAEPDMKLHLKFEIEVLCNKLEINLKDLKPGTTLRNSDKMVHLKPQLSQLSSKRAESTPILSVLQGKPVYKNEFFYGDLPGEQSAIGGSSIQSNSAGATPTPPTQQTGSSTPTPQTLPQSASEPKFIYNNISQLSLSCFDSHISISAPGINSMETHSQLKQLVRHAIDLAVQEIITVVSERSIKVAIDTTEHIIKKDFALDPDETRMRAATHHMVRNLTAANAMIPCRDHLASTIAKGIKQGILAGNTRKTNPTQIEQIDQLAASIGQENVGIACAFIQKTAAENAVVEMDKRLTTEYENRKLARAEGRRYCDPRALTYQAERMPEQIRLKVGRVTPQQMAVYEEFARNIPGFVPITDNDSAFIPKPVPVTSAYGSEESSVFLVLTERIIGDLEETIKAFSSLTPSPLIAMMHSLLEGLLLYRASREPSAAQLLVKRAVENLLEGMRDLPTEPELNQLAIRIRDMHLLILKAMADGASWTSKFVAKCWVESREEIRYNINVMDWLLRSSLINLQMIDEHLAHSVDLNRMIPPYVPLVFVMQIVQAYLIDDVSSGVINESDLPLTLQAIITLCQTPAAPDGLVSLIDTLRMKHDYLGGGRLVSSINSNTLTNSLSSSLIGNRSGAVTSTGIATPATPATPAGMIPTSSHHFHSGVNQAKDFHDPQGLQEKTDHLLRQWIQMYHAPNAGHGSATAFQHFVKEMDLHGILKTDDVITRFFRICITMCRELCIRSISEAGISSSATIVRNKCFPNLDAFVRLIALLVKQSGEPSNPTAKINLLNKVLGLICGIMLNDIERNQSDFHQLPYHRILIMLFLELNAPESVLESINLPVLMAFTQTLHLLRPSKCPGFAYAWLEMVSHRVLIGRMLAITPQQKGWSMYSMLLTDLFKFLAPFLRNVELSKPFTMLYKGTLRVLLVLLHDFPEFLCEYHYTFCDVIPPNCIQMRNLILSAYPRNMRLPDPFMPNLKVDRLPEISVSPKIHTNVASLIVPSDLKKNLDSYLKNRTPVTFLSDLRGYLRVSNEPGQRYNMSVMNALVLYVGMQAIAQIQSKGITPSMPTIAHSAHMDIFENLAVDLETEGRYLFLIAIANQLRYPNSHTHYFSCTLLYLFTEANTEAIQEQITRVLLERLIGNRPQPWGLLITFIELIKNPSFKFWSHEFVKCAPEIEKIFESVARSCMVPKGSQPERE